jgi:hypothetical protein
MYMFLPCLGQLAQQFQQLAFPDKMPGNLTTVKQDDRNVASVPRQEFWVLRDVHDLNLKRYLLLAAIKRIFYMVAEMTGRL